MFRDREFFIDIKPFDGFVILGDGCTKLPIEGIGSIAITIDDHYLIIPDVRFAPSLSESIYSLLQHIKQPGRGLQSSFETGLHISFPGFITAAIVGQHDIYLNGVPMHTSTPIGLTDSLHSTGVNSEINVCCHATQSTSSIESQSKDMANLLKSLRRYYESVRSHRELNIPVPAGFRQRNHLQQLYHSFTPPRKARAQLLSDISADVTEDTVGLLSHIQSNDILSSSTVSPDIDQPNTDESSTVPVPLL
jgi:hypothetical protein